MKLMPRAKPIFFGLPERPLFGWLHRPATPRGDLGLVICPPFGHEAQNIHRSVRHFAEASAAVGTPALRFDYDGTGDSCGEESESQRLTEWVQSVHRAVETLKESTGVTRVTLLGIRLGALLAALAAAERGDVESLVLIAPIMAGKPWLREMRALHGALGLSERPANANALPEGAREAVGFLLSAETQSALSEVDLTKLTKAPAPSVLILDRDDLPGNGKLAAHFAALGAKVESPALPGYADMMHDPHQSQVPAALIEATTEWLCVHSQPSIKVESPSPSLMFSASKASISDAVQEHAVFLDAQERLFGIVSTPQNIQPKRALVLVSSGANHRTGPNRLYVKLARHWAARGYLVLRFDIAGLGDSLPHAGEDEHVVYPPHATDDVSTAIAYLKANWGIESCHVAGLCSGGYHAFKAALAGAEMDSVIFINPLTFRWKPGTSLDAPSSQDIAEAARYKQSMMQGDKWKRLLTGETKVTTVMGVVARRGVGVAARGVTNTARRIGIAQRDSLGAELDSLAQRGIDLRFVFATGDPGFTLLHEQAGPTVARLMQAGQLQIQTIDGPDHTFTALWSHERLAEALDAAIE